MTDLQNRQTKASTEMPRREFIRKSLLASGGTFVGMASVGKFTLPELTNNNTSKHPSSSYQDQWKKERDRKKRYGGGSEGIYRLEKTVKTVIDDQG